ncbi:Oidioi.mRNA.OKI2018_I69.PAR.g8834.t1.cds [Oikopleura dioica]|uniref:Oidioi.mRNA.OKI2018_I69.PAR.g8834.t1.cds n=1 Tax=Oikopleura dioica TaxID=34765 RepID=A0ABN7RN79_OIKDI|nr:Oidioi.mRNA.OKI2018_I69.PAR.g8834.t1.cds [Oikopleura dioica]
MKNEQTGYGSFKPMLWFFIILWGILGFIALGFFFYLKCAELLKTKKHSTSAVQGHARGQKLLGTHQNVVSNNHTRVV